MHTQKQRLTGISVRIFRRKTSIRNTNMLAGLRIRTLPEQHGFASSSRALVDAKELSRDLFSFADDLGDLLAILIYIGIYKYG